MRLRSTLALALASVAALLAAGPAPAAWPGHDGPVLYRGFEPAREGEGTEPAGLRGFSFLRFGHVSEYTGYRTDRDPQVSPAGDRGVWTSYDRPSQSAAVSAIYIAHLSGTGHVSGGGVRRIVGGRHGFQAREATFAPSGKRILFVANGAGDVYSVRLDGGGLRRITHGPSRDAAPAFSPRGNQIAFQRAPGSSASWHLFSSRPDGSRLRDLTPNLAPTSPASDPDFSPDGRTIAFAIGLGTHSRIWTMRADGSHLRLLSTRVPGGYGFAEPVFSPSGDWLLVTANSSAGPRLARIPVGDPAHPRMLPRDFGGDSPVWAPG